MARITLATTISTGPAEIIKALDSPGGIAGFWTEEIDYRGVGQVLAAGFADSPAPFRLRVDEVTPAAVRWTNVGEFPPFFAGTTVTWALLPAPEGEGTMVHFTHDGWPDDEMPLPMIAYVWAQVLASLKSYLETGTGRPLHTRR
jgi:uncharacterized protein YndB with AHSA1/START domain